jgi:uncharacterized protein YjbI with pentapeptide repeats
MSTITIKNRFTDTTLFTCELPEDIASQSAGRKLGYAIKEALKARANLARAYLADAYLARAYLADAYLARANLAGANLADANLAGANLADANLAGAYLADAYLARADLARANLAGADLADAYLAGADLADAYLAGADLADADLARAYLAGADLARANLAGANLADANLAGANLADANLAGAYLADANLAGAYLARANLAGADLARAYLAHANLAGVNLAGARNIPADISRSDPVEPYERDTSPDRYQRRAERFRARNPDVPVITDIDAQILGILQSGVGKLDMSRWHACETTHCRAGWAITLAGEPGKQLEERYGPHHAGRMIYIASTGRSPHFFASNQAAMEDLRERAAEQTQGASS